MLTFLSFVVVMLNFLIFNVSSRTCICAAFNPDKCNEDANCEWNNNLPTTGITRGFHGICRTIRFMECKRNPNCTLKNKDPREYNNTLYSENMVNDDLDINVKSMVLTLLIMIKRMEMIHTKRCWLL